jgi:hypothetical protein
MIKRTTDGRTPRAARSSHLKGLSHFIRDVADTTTSRLERQAVCAPEVAPQQIQHETIELREGQAVTVDGDGHRGAAQDDADPVLGVDTPAALLVERGPYGPGPRRLAVSAVLSFAGRGA